MDIEKFGKHLRKLRMEKGLTQKDFGEKLGVSFQAVSKWEIGRCLPDITTLHSICKILNVDLNTLMEIDDSHVKDITLQYFKKNKKYKRIIIVVGIISIILLLIGGIFYYRHQHNFEFKTISTSCKDFNIKGSAAYDHNKTYIYISEIDYCGEKNDTVYKSITCNLYEKYGNTTTLVSSCDNVGEKINLDEFLKDIQISANNYSAMCKKFASSDLLLHITALEDSGKTILYEIPITFEENC